MQKCVMANHPFRVYGGPTGTILASIEFLVVEWLAMITLIESKGF